MKVSKSNILKVVLRIVVSVVLLFLIFRFIEVEKFYNELINANLYYILIASVFVFILEGLKALRWKNIIKSFNTGISFKDSLKFVFISLAFGLVTPSRVGEFIKGKYLADKTEIGYFKSFSTIIIDKLFDFIATLFLGLIGLSFLGNQIFGLKYSVFIFIIYLTILIFIFIFFDKILKLISLILPNKLKDNFKNLNITRSLYIKSLLISIIIWILLGTEAFFIIKSLGVSQSSLPLVMIAVPLMALSSVIPISIGGIGVREVVVIYFFSLSGISAEKSALFSLIYTFIGAGMPAVIGAVLYLKGKTQKNKTTKISRNISCSK